MKKHFWKIEYSITLFCILAVIILFIPMHIETYLQASMIKLWKDRYSKTTYIFNVINAQTSEEIIDGFQTLDANQQETFVINLIKPYMRLESMNKIPWKYRPKYLNGSRVSKKDDLYFNELYLSEKQRIIGIKNISDTKNKAWFAMMFDINGLLPPNVWGKDIFGIYIYDKGIIKPFGYDLTLEEVKKDCSRQGKGLSCSYYYLIGGDLND